MKKHTSMIFIKSEFNQCVFLLNDPEIGEKTSAFLLRFFNCEAFAKKLIKKYRKAKSLPFDRKHFEYKVGDVKKALKYFEIDFEWGKIYPLFGGNDSNYVECSAKCLRNKLVHDMNENVLRVVVERYDDLMDLMKYFEGLFI